MLQDEHDAEAIGRLSFLEEGRQVEEGHNRYTESAADSNHS